MIRLDCAGRASAISLLATIVVSLCFTPAYARHHNHRLHVPVPIARPAPDAVAPMPSDYGVTLSDPILSIVSADEAAASDTPVIVSPARRIYCVEFARLLSGIAIFGDARTWWDKAKAYYAQATDPSPGAVMVFDTRKKMRRGHVAVVRRVVSNREIRVDHANWGRDGRIYLNAPVIDVSPENDWSRVRVWNTRAGQMGSSTYTIKGFILSRMVAVN
jgi:hypothetical protein